MPSETNCVSSSGCCSRWHCGSGSGVDWSLHSHHRWHWAFSTSKANLGRAGTVLSPVPCELLEAARLQVLSAGFGVSLVRLDGLAVEGARTVPTRGAGVHVHGRRAGSMVCVPHVLLQKTQ